MCDAAAVLDMWATSSQEGVFTLDAKHRIQRINRAASYLLDLPGTPESWLGRPIWDLVGVVRRTSYAVMGDLFVDPQLQTGVAHQPYGGTFNHEGRTLHWQSIPVPADGEGNDGVAHLIIIRDATDSQHLRDMHQDLDALLSTGLHDPLQHLWHSLRGLIETVPPDPPPHHAHLTALAQAQDRASLALCAVETLIEISRLKSGLAPLSPSAFSFAAVAEDALKAVQEQAAARQLSLEGHIAAALPPTWGDRELIQRVVVHLLTEAVESSAQGDTIAITATVASPHHDKIRVAIKESNPSHGVSEDTHVDNLPDARHQIALMFCQATLEAHRERLWVSQTPQRGRTVMFTLPQVTEVLQQAQAIAQG